MSLFPLDRLLARLITHGEITVVDAKGEQHVFGRAGTGPSVTIRISDPGFVRRLMRRPSLLIGEGYMDGAYSIEAGTLRDFLEIVVVSSDGREPKGFVGGALVKASELTRRNNGARAARNVKHHYDIDHRLYEMFLDQDMQYSCAYWRDGVTSLDQAQRDKKRHIARKLLLEPGMEVLDIGSGWGGLALTLARDHGVRVTGVTLSLDQYQTSLRRVQEAGLSDRVTFKLLDYRDEPGRYDRIVSVGMFEHVGRRNFGEFFDHLDRLLKPDGIALLHTIGRMATPAPINAWMEKYIFPGSYLPSLSQLAPLLEQRGLWLTDFEMLRLHYAKTLAAWDERFRARRSEIAAMFDERFCRMWEFYLQLCEAAFRHRTLVVFQMQMAKQMGALPITRDYVYGDGAETTHQAAPADNTNKAAIKRRARTAAKSVSGASGRRSAKGSRTNRGR
jgi:cyclopropane-fatty-acyl-phospholipid synthase